MGRLAQCQGALELVPNTNNGHTLLGKGWNIIFTKTTDGIYTAKLYVQGFYGNLPIAGSRWQPEPKQVSMGTSMEAAGLEAFSMFMGPLLARASSTLKSNFGDSPKAQKKRPGSTCTSHGINILKGYTKLKIWGTPVIVRFNLLKNAFELRAQTQSGATVIEMTHTEDPRSLPHHVDLLFRKHSI